MGTYNELSITYINTVYRHRMTSALRLISSNFFKHGVFVFVFLFLFLILVRYVSRTSKNVKRVIFI